MIKLRTKTLLAFLAMLFLTLMGNYILFGQGLQLVREREDARNERKLDSMAELYDLLNNEVEESNAHLRHLGCNNVRFTAAALKFYLTDYDYNGPRVFDDGVVFKMKDGQVIFPEDMPESLTAFSTVNVENALSDPDHFGGILPKPGVDQESLDGLMLSDVNSYLNSYQGVFIEPIGNGYYYADLTDAEDFQWYLQLHLNETALVNAAEKAYDGALLIVNTADPELPLLAESSWFNGFESAAALGLTEADIRLQRKSVRLNGEPWLCTYKKISADENTVLVFGRPSAVSARIDYTQAALIALLMMLSFITMITYITSAQEYVQDKILTGRLKDAYLPASLRRRVMISGAIGAVIIFLVSSLIQAVSVLHSETLAGGSSFQILFENLQQISEERSVAAGDEEEDWYVYYGKKMADFLVRDPELITSERLQEFCDKLEIDYIMVFDAEGKETLCSRSYTGFRLGPGKDDHWYDFRRLLMGIPFIIRDAELDPVTGLERQLIGVTVPHTDNEANGAIIMALDPARISTAAEDGFGINEQLKSLIPEGTDCFVAENESGKIIYSSNPSYIGDSVTEYGFSDRSLRDGYMDFVSVNGNNCYAVTSKSGEYIIYNITAIPVLFSHSVGFGLMAVFIFLGILFVLYRLLMKGYTDEAVNLMSKYGTPVFESLPAPEEPEQRKKKHLFGRSAYYRFRHDKWKQATPESRTGIVFRSMLCLLIIMYFILHSISVRHQDDRLTLLNYILHGDWMRGINLFSICAIGCLVIGIFLFLTICRVVMQLLSKVLGSKGVTISRLMFNLIEYIAVFAFLYLAFSYLGFPTSTVLASIGLATLAISLGAQGLVADILAGISIVFEGEFQVGDFIEIDGFEGFVEEIGVRTTKIRDLNLDVKIIENSSIKNVTNKTRFNSLVIVDLTLPASESLERAEEVLKKGLPQIGRGSSKILDGPDYLGVQEVSRLDLVPHETSFTLRFSAECRQQDYLVVRRYLNRELLLLCEKEDLKLV